MWKYYDFRQNWQLFLEKWKDDSVQNQLHCDLMLFFDNTIYKNTLFEYSSTDYWYDKAEKLALEHVTDNHMIKQFSKSMHNTGLKLKNPENMFFSTCFGEIVKDYLPKSDTIDSFIMHGSETILLETYYEVAKLLFPNSEIITYINIILVPSELIIFDIHKYYFEIEIDQHYYNSIYGDLLEELSDSSSNDSLF
jgi:hypothetical protein